MEPTKEPAPGKQLTLADEMQYNPAELIVIEQLPLIREQLAALGARIDEKIQTALAIEANGETIKLLTAARADLNRHKDALESRRKQVKAAILAPYDAFEAIYKTFIKDNLEAADATLKKRIEAVRTAENAAKVKEVTAYFEEYKTAQGVTFLVFEQTGISITASKPTKALMDKIAEFVDRVADDVAKLKTLVNHEEIFVEYLKTLDLSRSIGIVAQRKQDIETQKARLASEDERQRALAEAAEKAAEYIPPPEEIITADDFPPDEPIPPVRRLNFWVEAPIPVLRKIKQFFDELEKNERRFKYGQQPTEAEILRRHTDGRLQEPNK